MKESVRENHQKYLDRIRIFKDAGCDMEFEREALLEQALPVSGSILEIGTGKGYLSIALAKKGYSLISVDIAEEEQQFARLNAEYFNCRDKIDFHIADAEHLMFSDHSFDVIFSVNALHHFSHPYKVADEMIRVLKSSGKLIISDFSQKGFDLVSQIHEQEGRQHSRGSVSVNAMGGYFKTRGFIVQKHRTVFQETLVVRYKNGRPA